MESEDLDSRSQSDNISFTECSIYSAEEEIIQRRGRRHIFIYSQYSPTLEKKQQKDEQPEYPEKLVDTDCSTTESSLNDSASTSGSSLYCIKPKRKLRHSILRTPVKRRLRLRRSVI